MHGVDEERHARVFLKAQRLWEVGNEIWNGLMSWAMKCWQQTWAMCAGTAFDIVDIAGRRQSLLPLSAPCRSSSPLNGTLSFAGRRECCCSMWGSWRNACHINTWVFIEVQTVSQLAHETEKNIAPPLNVSSLEDWQHYSPAKLVNHQLNKDLLEAGLKNVTFQLTCNINLRFNSRSYLTTTV